MMVKIDYKKLNKELYSPGTDPSLITVPAMKFIMVDGHGNPNDSDGEYSKAVELLYSLSYSIKMNNKKAADPDFFDYVVPPLEGLWWLEDKGDKDFSQREKYCWTSMIRQPDFITVEMFRQASEAVKKKNPELDPSKVRLQGYDEGLCIQCMHIGPYADEDITLNKMDHFLMEKGLKINIGNPNPDGHILRHHEIYLSDPRKTDPAKMNTILRHPVK